MAVPGGSAECPPAASPSYGARRAPIVRRRNPSGPAAAATTRSSSARRPGQVPREHLPADHRARVGREGARRLPRASGGGRGPSSAGRRLLVPEEDGGGSISGHGLLDLVLVAEEMGRRVSPGPLVADQRGGRRRWPSAGPTSSGPPSCPGSFSGEAVATWCLAEPGRRGRRTGVSPRGHRRRRTGSSSTAPRARWRPAAEADRLRGGRHGRTGRRPSSWCRRTPRGCPWPRPRASTWCAASPL